MFPGNLPVFVFFMSAAMMTLTIAVLTLAVAMAICGVTVALIRQRDY